MYLWAALILLTCIIAGVSSEKRAGESVEIDKVFMAQVAASEFGTIRELDIMEKLTSRSGSSGSWEPRGSGVSGVSGVSGLIGRWSGRKRRNLPRGSSRSREEGPQVRNRRSFNSTASPWPDGVINYRFDADFKDKHWTDEFEDIFDSVKEDFEDLTCGSLKEWTNEPNYISIHAPNAGGCWSYIGMQGGRQPLGLGKECHEKRVIVHELLHAFGFKHEQSRPDRDEFVEILYNNVIPGTTKHFEKISYPQWQSFKSPYDYESVMHYGATFYSMNGGLTIRTLNHLYQDKIGTYQFMSHQDVYQFNKVYKCDVSTKFDLTLSLVKPSGEILSPRYPANFPGNTWREWRVTVPRGRVKVESTEMNLESVRDSCPFDFVQIFDGHSLTNTSLGIFCGVANFTVMGSGSQLMVRFVSDGRVHGRFKLLSTSDVTQSCEQLVISNGKVIYSTNTRALGVRAHISCEKGYTRRGDDFLVCRTADTDLLEWSGIKPICERGACGDYPLIENAQRRGTSKRIGAALVYTCHSGYFIQGSARVVCQADGEWSAQPMCTQVAGYTALAGNCRGNFIATYNSATINLCAALCSRRAGCAGVSFSSSSPQCLLKSRSCEFPVNGSYKFYMKRITDECGNFPQVENTRMTGSRKAVGAALAYTCQSGFDMQGSADVVCQSNKEWSAQPVCVIRVAGYTALAGNCDGNSLSTHNNIPIDECAALCSANSGCTGFSFSRSRASCLLKRRSCENPVQSTFLFYLKNECGDFPRVEHALRSGSRKRIGATLEYACLSGFSIQGSARVVCQEDRKWSAKPECVGGGCGDFPRIENAMRSGSSRRVGAALVYSCIPGFVMQGSSRVLCQSSKIWSAQPTCVRTRETVCGGDVVASAGSIVSPNYPGNYPSNVNCTSKVTVPEGFIHFYSSDFRTQEADESSCHDPVNVWEGHTASGASPGFWCGSAQVNFTTIHNQAIMRFRSDSVGNYRGFKIHFETVSEHPCRHEMVAESGDITSPGYPANYANNLNCYWIIQVPEGKQINFLSSAFRTEEYSTNSCFDYVRLWEDHFLNKDRIGEWCGSKEINSTTSSNKAIMTFTSSRSITYSGFKVHFKAVSGEKDVLRADRCDGFPSINNGERSGRSNRVGAVLVYTCHSRFIMQGLTRVICQDNGDWSARPLCVLGYCGEVPRVENARRSGERSGESKRIGASVTFICRGVYRIQGSERVVCKSNGLWSDKPWCALICNANVLRMEATKLCIAILLVYFQ